MNNTLVRDLIEAGVHFGHRAGRWNPKMKPYIFCTRNAIHIIDIKETIKGLLRAKKFLASVASSGKNVLFVGTKRQARQPITDQAVRCGMPYVTERWLGGMLTNFSTIRSRLGRLKELEEMEEKGLLASESKKMQSALRREMRKIKGNLEGIRHMERLPGALVVIDARREHIAINEARKMKIPTVCLMDTDSDPDIVDLPIPGNDDAMRAIELITQQLADAILEGKAGYAKAAEAGEEASRRGRSQRMSTARVAQVLAGDHQSLEIRQDADRPITPPPSAPPASESAPEPEGPSDTVE